MAEEEFRTTDDFFEELKQIEQKVWIKRVWYHRRYYLRLPWTKTKDSYYGLIAFWQRGRRGWADCDTWNMDYHLAEIIGPMLRHLAETSHGFPADPSVNAQSIDGGDELEQ